ncbi:hypothetical protein I6N96_11420 [Enterococcus sp. BWM-S5]|uniref:TraX protein n=1 Tax=Enterococcus larvae TaxID=2794352 RepID=A0ABS4CJT3_9ENTE|nr:TraX family protein [Enterococcus larvae]MBP1046878.1 hypothetical protein [Enterococcus larvae]
MNTHIETGKRGLTTFDLKVLGITFMFIDHIHEMFALMGAPSWLDWFGRPVATLFFFISVEGFTHTRNKERYLKQLWLGFIVMNIGNYLVQHFFSLGNMGLMNNIFTDLFIAVLSMYGIELIKNGHKEKAFGKIIQGILCIVLPLVMSALVFMLMTNGSTMTPALILGYLFPTTLLAENSIMIYLATVLYLLRNNRLLQCLAIAIVSALYAGLDIQGMFTTNIQWMMVFAIVPILLYNGQKGKGMKQFFYLFYPAHIWLLYIIASVIYNHLY